MNKLAIAAVLVFAVPAGAEVYTWVDEDGQVHYSDRWVPGCEEVEMPEFPAAAPPVSAPAPPPSDVPLSPESKDAMAPAEPVYQSLAVVSPAEDECLRRTGGIVKILVDIDPAPQPKRLLQQPGHRMRVHLDGEPMQAEFLIGLQDGLLALFLTEVFRGTHQLQVMIEDAGGQRLAQSEIVNFHVQQFSPIIREKQLREQSQPPLSPP